jgi:RNA ligase (TIGR02306 family)
LATVRKISELLPIEGADRIEMAVVDGWQVVTQKGIYSVGDPCIYLEIDSWVPSAVAPFLTKDGHYPRVFQGVEGERLKTIRLRGQISQGLLLQPTVLVEPAKIGDDVTDALGILKWDKPLPAELRGISLGYFPGELRKTDQERIQNCKELLAEPDVWEATVKLDGSSMTAYIDGEGVFHVCSRNLRLKETEENSFWKAARKFALEEHIRAINEARGTRVALQGELCGPSIQGNKEGFFDLEFFLFDVFDVHMGEYLLPSERIDIIDVTGLPHVPVVDDLATPASLAEILTLATGPSLNAPLREGLVFKSKTVRGRSFKAISNEWLLKHGE